MKSNRLICIIMSLFSIFAFIPVAKADEIRESTYNIQLRSGGRYLNVYAGTDKDGANVCIWDNDGSKEQKYKIKSVGGGKYRLFPLSSSDGNSRAVDVNRGSSYNNPLKTGLNIDIWQTNDAPAQEWILKATGDGYYTIELAALSGGVITCNNPWANDGNVFLGQYAGKEEQQWKLIDLDPVPTPTPTPTPVPTPTPESLPGAPVISVNKTQYVERETLQFTWNHVQNASVYWVAVSKEPYGGANIVNQSDKITGTSYSVSGLAPGKYRANMQAENHVGLSKVSNTLYFEVIAKPALTPTPISLKNQQTIAFAKGLWKVNNAQGIVNVVKDFVQTDTQCIQAILACKSQAAWNNVTLDMVAASVKATLTVYSFSTDPGIKEAMELLQDTTKDTAISFGANVISTAIPSHVTADDFVWNLSNNAANSNLDLIKKFTVLHVRTNDQIMTYEDAVNYITLYSTLRMNSRTVRMGVDYFMDKLPDGFAASLKMTLSNTLKNLVIEDISNTLETSVGVNLLEKWYGLSDFGHPAISSWAQDMQKSQKELFEILLGTPLTLSTPVAKSTPTPTPSPAVRTGTVVNTGGIVLNVRESSSLSARVIGKLPANSVVTVLGVKVNNFYHVQANGIDGWSSADYIGFEEAQEISAFLGKRLANFDSSAYKKENISYNAGFAGQCTWYCVGRALEKTGIKMVSAPNAKNWLTMKLPARAYVVNDRSKVRANSIAVKTTGQYGHVMFVEDVKDEVVYYTEANVPMDHKIDVNDGKLKSISIADFTNSVNGYIYLD